MGILLIVIIGLSLTALNVYVNALTHKDNAKYWELEFRKLRIKYLRKLNEEKNTRPKEGDMKP